MVSCFTQHVVKSRNSSAQGVIEAKNLTRFIKGLDIYMANKVI